ncbi:uncharacterized protein LOC134214372 isoform X2 [Armigeres subalbatus]|uniref:uncharacterized protein LOC134214372 isoform X2 n=1 Tax=Armigeres subalbatus TaxID=124917 RepID=UPI002ECFBF1A
MSDIFEQVYVESLDEDSWIYEVLDPLDSEERIEDANESANAPSTILNFDVQVPVYSKIRNGEEETSIASNIDIISIPKNAVEARKTTQHKRGTVPVPRSCFPVETVVCGVVNTTSSISEVLDPLNTEARIEDTDASAYTSSMISNFDARLAEPSHPKILKREKKISIVPNIDMEDSLENQSSISGRVKNTLRYERATVPFPRSCFVVEPIVSGVVDENSCISKVFDPLGTETRIVETNASAKFNFRVSDLSRSKIQSGEKKASVVSNLDIEASRENHSRIAGGSKKKSQYKRAAVSFPRSLFAVEPDVGCVDKVNIKAPRESHSEIPGETTKTYQYKRVVVPFPHSPLVEPDVSGVAWLNNDHSIPGANDSNPFDMLGVMDAEVSNINLRLSNPCHSRIQTNRTKRTSQYKHTVLPFSQSRLLVTPDVGCVNIVDIKPSRESHTSIPNGVTKMPQYKRAAVPFARSLFVVEPDVSGVVDRLNDDMSVHGVNNNNPIDMLGADQEGNVNRWQPSKLHNMINQSRGPWANLAQPGNKRGVLKDVSTISNFNERRRMSSVRASYDSTNNTWNEYPSFQHIEASTPKTHIPAAMNLSINDISNDEVPLNLAMSKSQENDSVHREPASGALDLRRKSDVILFDPVKITHQQAVKEFYDEPKKVSPNEIYKDNLIGMSHIEAQVEIAPLVRSSIQASYLNDDEYDNDFTDDADPDWLPDGDATLLNDLSIYEYFEKFKNHDLSDHDAYSSSEAENDAADIAEPQPKRSKLHLQKKNKKLKEKGLPYKRNDGTTIPARFVKPPCCCRMRCFEKFSEPIRNKLLHGLLALTQSGQNQFLSSHISIINTIRPKVLISRRTRSRIYRLPGVGGAVKVCKLMFMSTFDLKDRKVRVLADKLVLGVGIAGDDKRKDNISRKQIDPAHVDYIIKHIKSFPAEESHYGREKSTCLFLSADLTISRMYELYQNQCGADNIIPVHYNTYRLAFKSLNIKFRKPKIDTCNTCDMLKVELQVEKETNKREEILARKQAHLAEAEGMYNEKKQDRLRANTNTSVRTISFDLQKQLATPHLTCGRAFYSRQLYTYNLTIFETQVGTNVPICYMWDETRAKRGSREVASCLWAYFKSLPANVEEIVMYSDRCAGQNNNRTILFLMAYVIEMMAFEGRKFSLCHKFMTSGHSHMECDTIHSAIERAKKRTQVNIETPRDWSLFISSIKRSTPIVVKDMNQTDILNWIVLDKRYTLPKFSTDNEPFKFKSARIFLCSTETPGIATYQNGLDDTNPKQINLLTSKSTPLLKLQIDPIFTSPIQLPTAKLEDLRRLLPFVAQKWYYEAFLKTLAPPGRGRKLKIVDNQGFDDDLDVDVDDD